MADPRSHPTMRSASTAQWAGLSRVQSLQDEGEPAARYYPPAAGYPDLEARSLAQEQVLSERSVGTSGEDDKLSQARITPYKRVHPNEER
jgi:hypothetical protein